MGILLVDDGEPMREVECLALCDKRCNGWPSLRLSGVREKVHDDCSAIYGLFDGEEGFTWYLSKTDETEETGEERTDPAIFESLFPALAILADTDDDIETVITSIQTLAVALRTIANEGKSVIFEVVVDLGKGPVAALIDDLFRARKVESLDAARRESLVGRVRCKIIVCLGKFT